MNKNLIVAAVLTAGVPAIAQDSYWIANRASSDIMRVSAWGSVLERVATPTTLRSCTTAPDGKVWIVRFIQGTFDIYDPATAVITPHSLPSGSAFQIAFDAAGHAWITASFSVFEYDANGNYVQTISLSAALNSLGITVDADGNKWIARYGATVTKIDTTGVATDFVIAGGGAMLCTAILADFRGLGNPSHIWAVGDSSSNLAELDVNGNTLNVYPEPATSIGSLTFDRNGHIWVGSYGNGTLLQVDETNGSVLNTYTFPPSVNGLTTDSYGRILATARVTFSGVGPPCQLRRIDPATGALEIPALLTFGGFNAAGTQSAASSLWQYSLVVNPTGDMDGDGDVNYAEALGGTSPTDATSKGTFRQESFGVTQNGSMASFEVLNSPLQLWIIGFSLGLIPPTPVPGFGGLLRIDPGTLGLTIGGLGNTSIPFAIPLDATLIGFEFFTQGVTFNGVSFDFQNVSGMKIW